MSKLKFLVLGVGGAGCAVLDHIIKSGCCENITFVAADTETESLDSSKAHHKIPLSLKTVWGRNANSSVKATGQAVKRAKRDITGYVTNVNMAFIIAGIGRDTGTGAAPVIANIIRKMGVLTIGIAYMPFLCNGQNCFEAARIGLENFKKNVDSLLVVENENLVNISDDTLLFSDAYKMADEVARQVVLGLTGTLSKHGFVELSFSELKSALHGAGTLLMSLGIGEGEERAKLAVQCAMISKNFPPLPWEAAKHIVVIMTTGPDVKLQEVMCVANSIKTNLMPATQLIFGHVIDEEDVGESIKVALFITSYPQYQQFSKYEAASGQQIQDEDDSPILYHSFNTFLEQQAKRHKIQSTSKSTIDA